MLMRFLDNWPYKLAAVIIAILLRFYVIAQMNPHSDINVPVHVVGVPDGFEQKDATTSVKISVTGPSGVLDGLRQTDITAEMDASTAREGANQDLPILVSVVPELRGQVQVEGKTPAAGLLTLEAISSTRKPIRVLFSRVPPVGYTYGAPEVAPSMAQVSAPSSILNSVQELDVDVDDAAPQDTAGNNPINGSFEISARDDAERRVGGAIVAPTYAHVLIPLIKVASTKTVPVVPSIAGQPAAGYSIVSLQADPAVVTISGPSALLDSTSVVVTAPVDITGATADQEKATTFAAPQGITVSPSRTINVTVKIAPTADGSPAQANVTTPAESPAKP